MNSTDLLFKRFTSFWHHKQCFPVVFQQAKIVYVTEIFECVQNH